MIDEEGKRLYSQMMEVLKGNGMSDDELLDIENSAMKAFEKHMNVLNKTTRILYSKNGEVLMEC